MRSFVFASAVALLFATNGQAAEVIGTIVSTDPDRQSLVVRTRDGQAVTIRTSETTRIQQGDAVVTTTTLMDGTPVTIVTEDSTTGGAIAMPTATRILVMPAPPAGDDDDRDDDDDDVDVDIDDD